MFYLELPQKKGLEIKLYKQFLIFTKNLFILKSMSRIRSFFEMRHKFF